MNSYEDRLALSEKKIVRLEEELKDCQLELAKTQAELLQVIDSYMTISNKIHSMHNSIFWK